MEYLDLTLPTPAENLACDEALLDLCDAGAIGAVLRFWESPIPFVVIGYSNHMDREVNVAACERERIPILRRCSGGGAVLQGPGCLNYALILQIDLESELESIGSTNCHIMSKHRDALRCLGLQVETDGHTDLVLSGVTPLKFSGNSQRRKRTALLFHGTFLYDFDLELVERSLRFPSLQPDYRQNRSHAEFVTNISVHAAWLKTALQQSWDAFMPFEKTIIASAAAMGLAETKYNLVSWNRKT